MKWLVSRVHPAWWLVFIVLVGLIWWLVPRRSRNLPEREAVFQPLPRRIQVEVLNAGGTSGAAQRVALQLRGGGLDVVLIENAPGPLLDSSRVIPLVLVRRADTTGVGRIREVLGEIEMQIAPDPRPLVDLTVLVGRGEPAGEPAGPR